MRIRALLVSTSAATAALAAACGGHSTPAAPQPVTTTATATATGAPTTAPATSASPTDAGCTNLTMTEAVRSQLVAADARPGAALPTGTGSYYGRCGSTGYAWAHFSAAAGASVQQQVSFQDEGAAYVLLVETGGSWRVRSRQPAVEDGPSCTGVPSLPSALANLWHGCAAGQ